VELEFGRKVAAKWAVVILIREVGDGGCGHRGIRIWHGM
jgi:hypothetical protein